MAINEQIQQQVARLRAETDQIRAAKKSVDAESARARQQAAAKETRMADKRRAGELGRDWQLVQQRIDLRQTTMHDVIRGVDTSDAAASVRRSLAEKLPEARQVFADATTADDAAEALNSLAEVQQALAHALRDARNATPDR